MIDLIRLKSKIIAEAQAEAQKIIQAAEAKKEKIAEEREREITRLKNETEASLKQVLAKLQNKALSAIKIEANRMILEAKWQVINSLFETVVSQIKEDANYLDTLLKKIEQHKNSALKEIVLTKEDAEKIKPRLKSKEIKIQESNAIKGGVVIRTEDSEIDYSLSKLLSEIKASAIEEINKLLFK